ncbi:hypothetical protein ACSS6W_009641 [Trichoderma asperelloides]
MKCAVAASRGADDLPSNPVLHGRFGGQFCLFESVVFGLWRMAALLTTTQRELPSSSSALALGRDPPEAMCRQGGWERQWV